MVRVVSMIAALTVGSATTLYALPARAAAPSDVAVGDILALTFYLPINNPTGAEAQAQAIQTPGNAQYHHYLSVSGFVNSYGPSNSQIATLESILTGLGFTITYVFPNHLAIEAVSSAGNAQNTFGLTLKHLAFNGRAGIASLTPATIPPALKGLVLGVGGFNTVTHPHPRYVAGARGIHPTRNSAGRLVGGTPGNYLPSDFAKFYNVDPIYKLGITGRKSTIGIVTLNDFNTADAYAFWSSIGLNVSQSRVTKVSVDGGVTASSNNADGEGETDIDVEQSGAVAPDANLRVYIAPNISNANFIDGFEAAASENIADTVSSSWGEPELYFFYDLATQTSGDSFELVAFHDAFLEMALQGQTLYIASGDSGAFDTVRDCPAYGTPTATAPTCNAPYAVDHPASDPLVTAAGGTTLPFLETFTKPVKLRLEVDHQRAWGWDYIAQEAAAQGLGSNPCCNVASVFSVGDGGGVSSFWSVPWYQLGTSGITRTKTGQTLTQNSGTGSVLQYVLPGNFAGRNLPDISTNADPYSGYVFLQDGLLNTDYGGTSFVAPQLNGVTALFVQALGGRVGQINPALYHLGNPTTTEIARGDNWGYSAVAGYDNAVGRGVLNGAQLLESLSQLKNAR